MLGTRCDFGQNRPCSWTRSRACPANTHKVCDERPLSGSHFGTSFCFDEVRFSLKEWFETCSTIKQNDRRNTSVNRMLDSTLKGMSRERSMTTIGLCS